MHHGHANPPARRTDRIELPRLVIVTLCALLSLGMENRAKAEDGHESRLNGRWKWHFTMPDGSTLSPQVRLRYDGHSVSGITRFRSGSETSITNGRLQGDVVSFEVVRVLNNQRAVTRYAGVFRDDKIIGSIESVSAGKPVSHPWEAKRLPDTLDGTWKWSNEVRERTLEFSAKLRREGDKVHGKLSARKGAGVDIKEGRCTKEGQVSFEVERERDGEKFSSKFEGKLVGDTIKGKETVTTNDGEQVLDWIATRQD